MDRAQSGDLIYCDPPYTQPKPSSMGTVVQPRSLVPDYRAVKPETEFRGGQHRRHKTLWQTRAESHYDSRWSLFERELFIDVGRSMLKRFQMDGQTLEHEIARNDSCLPSDPAADLTDHVATKN